MRLISIYLFLLVFSSSYATANTINEAYSAHSNSDIQSIHIVNLLANTSLSDPGKTMTATPIVVNFFDGDSWPCWTIMLDYQAADTIYAGPYKGCPNKIDHITIAPFPVAKILDTYRHPDTVRIDTSKYSSRVIVTQNETQGPVFDAQSGLVVTPGVVKVKVETDTQ